MAKKSDYFKKIQMDLFDLLNLNPIKKFKDKDLLGPLKYLKEHPGEEIRPEQRISDGASDATKNETHIQEHSLNHFNENHNGDTIFIHESVQTPLEPEITSAKKNTNPKSLSALKTNSSLSPEMYYQDFVCGLPLIVHRKPYIRHIRFYVKPNSTLHAVAPLNRPIELIKKEISEHQEWVEKSNQSFQKLRDKFPVRVFQTSQLFPFLGDNYVLKIDAVDLKKPILQLDLDQLQYFYPQSWDLLPKLEKQALLKKHLMKFYHEKASIFLNQRLRILSEQTELFPRRLTFRNQKTRWGSCSTDGSLNLNWKLIAFDQSIIDYVIIHELCHLKHANHSKRFWSLVESHCADYKRLNRTLNQVQFEVDFLAAESELYFSNPTLL